MDKSLFSGSHVVVTGGAVHIGRAISEAFSAAGTAVTILYHGSEDEAKDAAAQLSNTAIVHADLRDEQQVRKAFAQAVRYHGEVDILINNAGIFHISLQEDLHRSDWDRVFEITTRSIFLCTREVLPSMKLRRSGTIVTIASINALQPGFGMTAHYDAAKAAAAGYTRSLAAEVGPYNIRVNAVAPGLTDSVRLQRDAPDLVRMYQERAPLRRLVKGEDIASAVQFLCSPASSAITGTILTVDCGYMLT